jgi:hypothetical protein
MCTSAGSLKLTPGGDVTGFTAQEWNATTGKWCNMYGLDGNVFSYAGTGSTSAWAVDTTNPRAMRLTMTVTAGQYAGGGVSFDSCVDASAFNSVEFTAQVVSGNLNNCNWQVQLQTQDQRPSTATDPTGGTCASNCYRYPTAANLAVPAAGGTTYTQLFTSFSNPAGSTIPTRTQLTGVQFQVNSNSGTGTCTVEMRFDSIRFVTQ